VSGERVVSSLVQRLGSLDFVSDNTDNFGKQAFPKNGRFIHFVEHWIYVATPLVCKFPDMVQVAADPTAVCANRIRCIDRPASCMELDGGALVSEISSLFEQVHI
jgi:hypothetical protein